MCLTTIRVMYLVVWLTLAGLQGTHMLCMGHYVMGPPQFCLRALPHTLTQAATGKWLKDSG